jgi:O-methyltransferase domain/Dimerisation domain
MSDSVPRPVLTTEQTTLLRMVYGALTSQVIYVAVRVGVADLLTEGPRTSSEVAAAAGANENTLRRLLRGLVSLGLCAEVEADRFGLTEMGQYLRSDRADSLHSRILFNTEVLLPVWGELLNAVRSGESGALRVFKMPLYEYFAKHSDIGGLFDRTMASLARYRVGPAVAAYDFSRFRRIVDVGGGNGELMLAILRNYSEPQGIVFDLPLVAERARDRIRAAGLKERCTVVSGDAADGVPSGADCYLLSNFLVSMNDALATTILRHCRQAMSPGGVVALIEWVMPTGGEAVDPYGFWDTASMDLSMLAIDGGAGWRVRTAREFRALLEAGGFTLNRIIPTGSSVNVIEALPA